MPQIAAELVVGPLSLANDIIGAVFASLALTYGWVWYRDRDPGIHWFAVSWALGGLWFFASSFHAPVGATIEWSAWQLVIIAAAAFATVGLTEYLEIPAPQRRRSRRSPSCWD